MSFKLLKTIEGNALKGYVYSRIAYYANTLVLFYFSPHRIVILDRDYNEQTILGNFNTFAIYENTIVASKELGAVDEIVFYQLGQDSKWNLTQTIRQPSGPTVFALSIAIYKNVCVIGSNIKLFIYEKKSKEWSLKQEILAPENSTIRYGQRLSITDDFISTGDRSFDTNNGVAYTYKYNGQEWVYNNTFQNSSVNAFPNSLDLNGDYFGTACRGFLQIYKRNTDNWNLVKSFNVGDNSDNFSSVCIYNNILVFSYVDYNTDEGVGLGTVYIFKLSKNGEWKLVQENTPVNNNEEAFGEYLALNGNRLIITAFQGFGKIYIYSL